MIAGAPIAGTAVAGNPGAFVNPVAAALAVTDTEIIQLPINCVLSGNQPLELGKTIVEYNEPNIRIIKRTI